MKRDQLHNFWRNPKRKKPDYVKANQDYTKRLVQSMLNYVDASASILEIGCNVGRNLNGLFQSGYEKLAGIEIDPSAIALMARVYPKMIVKTRIFISSLEDIVADFKDNTFDITFTMMTLMHIHPDSEFVFKEIVRVTKKFLIIMEIECPRSKYREIYFDRSYGSIFEKLGMTQVFEERRKKGYLRVFKK